RTQRKPATWKFLSCLVPEHLRKPRMGTPSHQGPYRVPKSTAHSGLAMDGTRLREQFRRAAHEYLLLPTHSRKPCPEFHAGRHSGAGARVWLQAENPPSQREDRPYRDRHETWRPDGGSQTDGNEF